uniref:Ribosomal protein L14 n=1 Tax=Rhodomonas salina TaxID=3034 RepID=Q9G8W6_RHDSA|nr:ribosomal protein L14 [Rhodomonas salina]AAG17731.1 ribosomal protein L14 [Rhodomonas salina]
MIQCKTIINIIDNSGIKTVRCIRNIKNNTALVSVFEKKSKTNIKKKSLFLAAIICEKIFNSKKNGIFVAFNKNNAVLLNSKNNLIGTRFFGPVPSKLRRKKFLKVLCLTLTII